MMPANIKRLLKFLGPEYTCRGLYKTDEIFRKINDSYDVEISGASRKGRPVSIYVWNIRNGMCGGAKIIERKHEIKDDNELKCALDSILLKYKNLA